MNANEFGKRLGIGVRVAGRIAQQRAQESAAQSAQASAPGSAAPASGASAPAAGTSAPRGVVESPAARFIPSAQEIRAAKQKTHKYSRAAGRGIGGFLRPFGRVGGILWLEVTGFFFGLFGLFFATDAWRSRLGYASGPLHQRFLIAAGLTAVFGYLSVSAFWRAKRR